MYRESKELFPGPWLKVLLIFAENSMNMQASLQSWKTGIHYTCPSAGVHSKKQRRVSIFQAVFCLLQFWTLWRFWSWTFPGCNHSTAHCCRWQGNSRECDPTREWLWDCWATLISILHFSCLPGDCLRKSSRIAWMDQPVEDTISGNSTNGF